MDYSTNFLEEVSEYVFRLLKENLSPKYVYHNFQHTLETVEACKKLAAGYALSKEDLESLLIAAWFHDTGYIYLYKGHEDKSIEITHSYLEAQKYPEEKIAIVKDCIEATKRVDIPRSILGKIIADADIIQIGEPTFFKKSALLKIEWENFNIRSCTTLDWAKTQLEFLQNTHFHTYQAQQLYGGQLLINIQKQYNRLQKTEEDHTKKTQPKRGIETMFRSLYRGHIDFSSMADSKANMLINIHSLIISISLTLVGAKFSLFGTSFKQSQLIIYPIIALLLTSVVSIIFAILSAKPTVTKKITGVDEFKNKNILFFGNYTSISLNDFEMEMHTLMQNETSVYDNMIKDLYSLGKVLRKKYRLLKIAYTTFMYGIILTVFVTVTVIIYIKKTDQSWPKALPSIWPTGKKHLQKSSIHACPGPFLLVCQRPLGVSVYRI